MTKIKKLIVERNIAIFIICLVAVVGVGLVVKAYVSNEAPGIVAEGDINIENYINEAPKQVPELQPVVNEKEFGALTSPDIISRYLSINGDVTYHATGDFLDATTTIVSIPNPFRIATTSGSDVVLQYSTTNGIGFTGATSTVDMVRLINTGVATSTFRVVCGASANNGYTGSSTIALPLLYSDEIATSSKFMIENNLSDTYNLGAGDSTTVAKVTLTPTFPYFVCSVHTIGSYDGAFTEVTNTFDGNFAVRINRQR